MCSKMEFYSYKVGLVCVSVHKKECLKEELTWTIDK